jgi:alkyl hydroperoxide reductase subunit AhpC
MIELGQLERRHEDFDRRNVRIIVVSVDKTEEAAETQKQFPHLTVLADPGLGLTKAAGLLQPGEGPNGEDVDVPTTILVDREGTVRWLYGSPSVIVRLSPDEKLAAVDQYLSEK